MRLFSDQVRELKVSINLNFNQEWVLFFEKSPGMALDGDINSIVLLEENQ